MISYTKFIPTKISNQDYASAVILIHVLKKANYLF